MRNASLRARTFDEICYCRHGTPRREPSRMDGFLLECTGRSVRGDWNSKSDGKSGNPGGLGIQVPAVCSVPLDIIPIGTQLDKLANWLDIAELAALPNLWSRRQTLWEMGSRSSTSLGPAGMMRPVGYATSEPRRARKSKSLKSMERRSAIVWEFLGMAERFQAQIRSIPPVARSIKPKLELR